MRIIDREKSLTQSTIRKESISSLNTKAAKCFSYVIKAVYTQHIKRFDKADHITISKYSKQ